MLSYRIPLPATGRACSEFPMEPPGSCQSCRQAVDERRLQYRRGQDVVRNEALLQCDICERFACADCLRVYDIYSGYDFLCHECARELQRLRLEGPGH
jgi:hypothetical protein